MAEPVTMDILVRLARVNGDLLREQNTATDTATVIAGGFKGALLLCPQHLQLGGNRLNLSDAARVICAFR
jgi:hypothetical protein